jgi:multidrug efflux pump subunit AcrB
MSASPRAKASSPAVTIAVAKRKGTNAIDVAQSVLAGGGHQRHRSSPRTWRSHHAPLRRDGAEKSNELLFHMGIAVVSVSLLIAFAGPARIA